MVWILFVIEMSYSGGKRRMALGPGPGASSHCQYWMGNGLSMRIVLQSRVEHNESQPAVITIVSLTAEIMKAVSRGVFSCGFSSLPYGPSSSREAIARFYLSFIIGLCARCVPDLATDQGARTAGGANYFYVSSGCAIFLANSLQVVP